MPQDFGPSGDNSVSRRHFLKAGAAFGGGLMIGWVPRFHRPRMLGHSRPMRSSASTGRAR